MSDNNKNLQSPSKSATFDPFKPLVQGKVIEDQHQVDAKLQKTLDNIGHGKHNAHETHSIREDLPKGFNA